MCSGCALLFWLKLIVLHENFDQYIFFFRGEGGGELTLFVEKTDMTEMTD